MSCAYTARASAVRSFIVQLQETVLDLPCGRCRLRGYRGDLHQRVRGHPRRPCLQGHRQGSGLGRGEQKVQGRQAHSRPAQGPHPGEDRGLPGGARRRRVDCRFCCRDVFFCMYYFTHTHTPPMTSKLGYAIAMLSSHIFIHTRANHVDIKFILNKLNPHYRPRDSSMVCCTHSKRDS